MSSSEQPKSVAKKTSKRSQQRRQARQFVLQSLYQWIVAENSPYEIEASMRARFDFNEADLNYYQTLMRGVVAHKAELETIMASAASRSVSEITPIEKSILYFSIFELVHLLDVPFQVVINEAVELAKSFGATDAHKFVNAALDKIAPTLRAAEVDSYRARRR